MIEQLCDVLTDRGTITTDERTNVLIVKDTQEALARAEEADDREGVASVRGELTDVLVDFVASTSEPIRPRSGMSMALILGGRIGQICMSAM